MNKERKFFVHMLGVLIMATDIILDYVQMETYWRFGSLTRDLFIASIAVMTIVPIILTFYLTCIFTNSKVRYLYKGICAQENNIDVLSGMFTIPGIQRVLAAPTCTPCLGVVSLATSFIGDVFMFMFLFVVLLPFMFVVVTFTPVAGLFIGWRDMETKDLKRYYLIRYLSGTYHALPHMVINTVFISRTDTANGTSISSLVFSIVSILQVSRQV